MKKILVILLAIVLLGCGKTTFNAELGKTFKMTSTDKVKINENDLKINGFKILEDSRCPKEVNCFWEGQVVAEFDLNGSPLKFNSFKSLDTLGYTFEIKSVQPEKLSESQKILEGAYILEILISK